jgi:hypothetical protein
MVAEPPPAAARTVPEYAGRLAALRRRWRRVTAGEGLLRVAAVAAGLLAAALLLDWWFGLPRPARVAALGVQAAALLAGLACWTLRPLRHAPADFDLARRVERARPELGGRLLAALDLLPQAERLPAGRGYVAALARETADRTGGTDWMPVISDAPLRRRARQVLPALLACALLLAFTWPVSRPLLLRAALVEVPRPLKTRLLALPAGGVVGRGDDVPFVIEAGGVLPRRASVELRSAEGGVRRVPLPPVPGRRGVFSNTLAAVAESFTAAVRAGDAASAPVAFTVVPRPALRQVAVLVTPPAYTGLPPTNRPLDDLVALAGSRLRLTAEATRPLARAEVGFEGLGASAAAVLAADRRGFTAEFTADDPRLTGFRLPLVDEAGLASRDDVLHRLQIVPDRPPQVRLVAPTRREELATTRATVPLGIEARDDFGVGALRVLVRPAGVAHEPPRVAELDLGGEAPRSLQRRFDLRLADLRPPPQPGVTYEVWVEAADRNDRPGPGLGRSELRLVRVVTDEEKRADLLSRADDQLGTLGDVADGQERLNQTLGRVILEKATPPR